MTFEDLRIRQDVLAPLQLPIEVREGRVGRLHMSGDWTYARGLRPRVVISDVSLQARSKAPAAWAASGSKSTRGTPAQTPQQRKQQVRNAC